MPNINDATQTKHFKSEQIKANINVLYTANWLHQQINSLLRPYKLTHEQFNVLRILRGGQPESMAQKDILCRMVAPNSNMTSLIKKLKSKELIDVCRSSVDRREYVISIRKEGLDLLGILDTELEGKVGAFTKLSVSEAFHLNALLDKLRDG